MRTLTIKAANGSVKDFKMDAELSWTVKKLKAYIYRHYPTHPPLTCQKLIHRGKLLLDQSTLSEAINTPLLVTEPTPEEEAVVIHLVAYERSNSITPSTSNTSERVHTSASLPTGTSGSGLRNRQPSVTPVQDAGRVNPPQQQQQQSPAQRQPSQRAPPLINPWLRHAGGVAGGVATNPIPAVQNLPVFGPGGVANGGYAFPQAPQFYQSPYGAAYANHIQQWYYNYYRTPGVGTGVDGEGQNHPHQDLPPNPVDPNDLHDNDLPEPDDQDEVPVNAPGGVGMMAGGGPGLHRRDMVDYLYMLSMIGFLVLMAFLTGSLGRLLIFAAGLTFMLLNQAGFFSLQRRRQPAPPPNPRPNFDPNLAREDNPESARPEVAGRGEGEGEGDSPDGGEQNAGAGAMPRPDHTPGPAEPDPLQQHPREPNEEEQRPGVVSTILVFITSFFTSLVPQQRPNLQVN